MKIGVLGFFQLRTMQYLTKYTDILDELNIDYDVIHWSRSNDDIAPSFKGRHIVFNYEMVTEQPFYKKIGGFLKYAYFMRKTIKNFMYIKRKEIAIMMIVVAIAIIAGIVLGFFVSMGDDETVQLGMMMALSAYVIFDIIFEGFTFGQHFIFSIFGPYLP